jgi:hypothetical protein
MMSMGLEPMAFYGSHFMFGFVKSGALLIIASVAIASHLLVINQIFKQQFKQIPSGFPYLAREHLSADPPLLALRSECDALRHPDLDDLQQNNHRKRSALILLDGAVYGCELPWGE